MLPRTVAVASILCLGLIAGCSVLGNFYPVKGPLAASSPGSVFALKFTLHPPASFTVTGTVAGESVTGTLYRLLPVPKNPPPVTPPPPMTTQWDEVYRQGAYVATVLGTGQDARGTLTGSNGTTFTVEIHAVQPATSGVLGPVMGVAEDSHGNLFKVTF